MLLSFAGSLACSEPPTTDAGPVGGTINPVGEEVGTTGCGADTLLPARHASGGGVIRMRVTEGT